MLYDPKWEQQTKAEPSFSNFVAWLETKDPNQSYNFHDCRGLCLIGQYMSHCGVAWSNDAVGDQNYKKFSAIIGTDGNWFSVPVAIKHPHTFGAALKRARAVLGHD